MRSSKTSPARATSPKINSFQVGDNVVYPSHGVGQITSEEIQSVAGTEVTVYAISFAKDKMILRVPKSRAAKIGLRHLSSGKELDKAIAVLKGKAEVSKEMWSRRAQKFETKIYSGCVVLIAEVVRDLHKDVDDPDRSYSEKVIYDLAFDRLINEYSVAMSADREAARDKILSVLNYMRN